MLNEIEMTPSTTDESSAQQARRQFLNSFGKLALVTPVVLTTLISPATSAAPKSCTGQGAKKCR